MLDQDLQKLVETISNEVFKKPFLHQAMHNHRLRTTGGRYMLGDHSIQINPLVLPLHGMEELIGVIKHELCHYHLHLEGKGYQHRDQDFKELLAKTSSPRYCKPLAQRNKRTTTFHIYECKLCKLQYKRKRRMDIAKYRCGKCSGEIIKVKSIST
ncbi:SprT family protein [Sporosarcina ureilytica]|uniref:Protein SprT-like n=1 Tax=Sporosarcina ureilytica TaxID=298596 RepID=A0A1D8JK56_9BACL|nr:SprT family protein [Sporosarcina ureilytica]AOV09060.1 SprT family protein [Sporosarcina ureilytica]